MNASPKIPIQNIYYLLCYAWNKLEERDIVDVSGIESTNLYDLFAKVLINGLSHLFKRGLDRGYVVHAEDTRCLSGKISFGPTLKRNLLSKAQIHCEYDELSHNVLHNQLLKATLRLLVFVEAIDTSLKNDLVGLYRRLHGIEDIELTYSKFSRVQLHQNNAFYDFLLKICTLVYDNLLVSEDPGKSKFRDFLQDERKMAYLFEEFVRNFCKIETHNCTVSREDIFWEATPLDDHSAAYLPKMTTDISITRNGSKAVIDTKYYRKALEKHYDQEKIHSTHLYQLHAYLTNLAAKGGVNRNCSGVLLYPTVDRDIQLNYILHGRHKIMIRTLNLNQDWQLIHKDLIEILEMALQFEAPGQGQQ